MACPGQNSTIGLPGYFHQIGGGFLIQTFKIAQSDGFESSTDRETSPVIGTPSGINAVSVGYPDTNLGFLGRGMELIPYYDHLTIIYILFYMVSINILII